MISCTKVFDARTEAHALAHYRDSSVSWCDGTDPAKFAPSNSEGFGGFPYYLYVDAEGLLYWNIEFEFKRYLIREFI